MNNQPRGELVPGGLAMVVKSTYQENIGKGVRLLSRLAPKEIVSAITLPNQDFQNRMAVELWHVSGDVINQDLDLSGESFFHESQLMPINPSADPLEITQQMEEKV